jgi:tetratricopeptide (TPR) repeat protein
VRRRFRPCRRIKGNKGCRVKETQLNGGFIGFLIEGRAVGEGQRIRIFVSSPSDVLPEREAIDRVVAAANARLGGRPLLETVRWESRFYTADATFQSQIADPGDCDLVVTLFWTRLGSELPPDFAQKMPDGRPWPSGTVYEMARALEARRAKGALPDVLVYRKTKPAALPTDDLARRRLQQAEFERFAAFWEEWFVSEAGHFRAGFKTFEDVEPFEALFARDLMAWLAERGHLASRAKWDIERRGSPFRGLLPFEAEHAEVFFGRGRAIERGVTELAAAASRGTPLLLIAGESGTGKSSLARAGLLPRVTTAGIIPDVDLWRSGIVDLGAGGDPFASVARALFAALPELNDGDFRKAEDLAAHFASGGGVQPVTRAIERAGEAFRTSAGLDRAAQARLILLVDQAEQMLAWPAAQHASLATLIQRLVSAGVWIAATLRLDSLGGWLADPVLAGLIEPEHGARLDLAPPGPVEIAEMVREPAKASGLSYETGPDGALDEILIEAARGRDALPLLQFTLEELFLRRDSAGRMTRAAYAALGGLEGAIGRQAEQAFASLPAEAKARLPRLLRALVRSQGETFALVTVPRGEVAKTAADAALISALTGARILVAGGSEASPTLRLAHEAVLRTWGEARDIAAANANFLRVREEVAAQHARWLRDNKRSDRLLPSGRPLAEAEEMVRDFSDELSADMIAFIRASGRRARIKQSALVAATLLFALVAAIAGFKYVEANRERARAEQAFAAAKGVVDGVVRDVVEGLGDIEGMRLDLKKRILDRVRTTIGQLEKTAPNNLELQRSREIMLGSIGDVLAAGGDLDAALKNYREAFAILDGLAPAGPANASWQRDLSVSYNKIGDVLVDQGNLPEALKSYRDGLTIADRLAKSDPGNAGWQRDLSVSYSNIGDVQKAQGNLPEALKSYRDGLEIADRLAKSDPSNANWQRDLSVSYNRIGDVLVAQGNLPEALESYRDGLAIANRLAKSDLGNAGWQRDLSVSYNKIGDVLVAQGHLLEALKSYRDALAIRDRLAKSDPGNSVWQRDLSVSYDKIGDALESQGNLPEALKNHRDGLTIAERLAKSDPGNAGWQRDLSVSYNKIGDVLVAQGNLPEALQSYGDGLTIAERLAKSDPGNTGWQRDLSLSYDKIGDMLVDQGNLPEALKSYRDGLAIADRLAKSDPGNAGWQRDLSVSYNKIGDVLTAQGNLPEALKSYRDALAIRDRQAKSDPGNAGWQRDLSVSYNKIGNVQKAQGNLPEALKSHHEAFAILDGLARADPGNAIWQRDLSVSYNDIGDVQKAQGNLPEALKSYRDALAIADRLARADPGNSQRQRDLRFCVGRFGRMAYNFILARQFDQALDTAEQSISLSPNEVWIEANRAHALMFLDRIAEARQIYLAHRGQKTQNDETWETVISNDFTEFRKAGLSNPLMDEIEKTFAKPQ